MLDNYDSTVRELTEYLIANAPPGAEREVGRLQYTLDNNDLPGYISLEFRPTQDVSCTLYVSLGKFGGERIDDEEGNTWYKYLITCEVSWPTWGSSDVTTSQRRLAVMTETTRFAAEVQARFGAPLLRLTTTKAQREAAHAQVAVHQSNLRVLKLVSANRKGMRVGQERRVEAEGPDLVPLGTVEVDLLGRHYTAQVTATRAFYFTRTS